VFFSENRIKGAAVPEVCMLGNDKFAAQASNLLSGKFDFEAPEVGVFVLNHRTDGSGSTKGLPK